MRLVNDEIIGIKSKNIQVNIKTTLVCSIKNALSQCSKTDKPYKISKLSSMISKHFYLKRCHDFYCQSYGPLRDSLAESDGFAQDDLFELRNHEPLLEIHLCSQCNGELLELNISTSCAHKSHSLALHISPRIIFLIQMTGYCGDYCNSNHNV